MATTQKKTAAGKIPAAVICFGSIYGRFGSVTFVSNVIRLFRRHTGAESAPCPHRGSSL